ncbi:hypothetical protein E2320_000971 [Naja naja]|nr:hypothetical protein E2320_000971 [Naja naja]
MGSSTSTSTPTWQVPGIFLEANFFGDGQWKDEENGREADCEFAIREPAAPPFCGTALYQHWNDFRRHRERKLASEGPKPQTDLIMEDERWLMRRSPALEEMVEKRPRASTATLTLVLLIPDDNEEGDAGAKGVDHDGHLTQHTQDSATNSPYHFLVGAFVTGLGAVGQDDQPTNNEEQQPLQGRQRRAANTQAGKGRQRKALGQHRLFGGPR